MVNIRNLFLSSSMTVVAKVTLLFVMSTLFCGLHQKRVSKTHHTSITHMYKTASFSVYSIYTEHLLYY